MTIFCMYASNKTIGNSRVIHNKSNVEICVFQHKNITPDIMKTFVSKYFSAAETTQADGNKS